MTEDDLHEHFVRWADDYVMKERMLHGFVCTWRCLGPLYRGLQTEISPIL